MAGFEQLIRETISQQAAGGPSTLEGRQSVYASSRAALDRMVAGNPAVTAEMAAGQRARLEEAIGKIEADLASDATPAAPTAPPAPPATEQEFTAPPVVPVRSPAPLPPSVRREPEPTVQHAPTLSARREPDLGPVPPLSAEGQPVDLTELEPEDEGLRADVPPAYRGKALREPRPYARMLMWAIILAGIGVAGWWGWTFGPEMLRQQIDGSVPNPPANVEQGAFVPDGGSGWLTVYMPGESPGALVTADRGTANITERGTTRVARLVSSGPSETGNILLTIPDGVIERINGRAATFEIMLAGAQGGGQQMAIYCDFGALGECGRKRFATEDRREALVFDVLLAKGELASGGKAYLAINTDLGGEGRSVDIERVRVRIST